ncbi:uncharacterized protein L203_106063 [Cryptococcus depauperatus CBS 7841]|uniref:Uncharacterized protein n=1 Tax=Cryptococcus depauperatus CBS 7841 TaxID=1295531 RepID=A0A1E3IV47_9TREE|nr:hypothetical protein L203_00770 [Cryptococcus depauperatus CBS 7841]
MVFQTQAKKFKCQLFFTTLGFSSTLEHEFGHELAKSKRSVLIDTEYTTTDSVVYIKNGPFQGFYQTITNLLQWVEEQDAIHGYSAFELVCKGYYGCKLEILDYLTFQNDGFVSLNTFYRGSIQPLASNGSELLHPKPTHGRTGQNVYDKDYPVADSMMDFVASIANEETHTERPFADEPKNSNINEAFATLRPIGSLQRESEQDLVKRFLELESRQAKMELQQECMAKRQEALDQDEEQLYQQEEILDIRYAKVLEQERNVRQIQDELLEYARYVANLERVNKQREVRLELITAAIENREDEVTALEIKLHERTVNLYYAEEVFQRKIDDCEEKLSELGIKME